MFSSARYLFVLGIAACAGVPSAPAPKAVSAPAAASPPAGARFDAAAIQAGVDPFFNSFGAHWGDSWKLSGAVYAVSGGKTIYERAFGYADRAARRAPDRDTSFRTGSVTKQFTAAAVMALVEAGKLRLDETITDVLPDYKGVNPNATVEQLLNHTAGIPNLTDVASFMAQRGQPHTPKQLIAVVEGLPASFLPGTQWAYSNTGYVLLGMMIEARSQQSYAEYVQARLFDRAGLTRTEVGDATGVNNRALGYRRVDDRIEPAEAIHMSVPWSAGAVRSTINDLVKWDEALRAGRVLSPESVARMYVPSPHASPYGPYAMGWLVDTKYARQVIAHGGGIDGFTSFLLRVPQDDLVIVSWTNTGVISADKLAQAVFDVAYGGDAPKRSEADGPDLPDWLAQGAMGTYGLNGASRDAAIKMGVPVEVFNAINKMAMTVNADGKRIVVKPNGQPAFELSIQADGKLKNKRGDISVQFVPDGGPIEAALLQQGPLTLRYDRVSPPTGSLNGLGPSAGEKIVATPSTPRSRP